MKYFLIKNVSMRNLFEPGGKAISWAEWGFSTMTIKGYAGSGWSSSDEEMRDHLTVLPITDEPLLNSKMDMLNDRIDTNLYENDSIEIISEAAAEIWKSTINDVREGVI